MFYFILPLLYSNFSNYETKLKLQSSLIMFILHMCSSGFVGNKWTHLHSHGQFTLYMKIILKCNKTIWWHCILRCIYWPQNMVHTEINVGHLTGNNIVNRVFKLPRLHLQVTPQHLIFLSYWHKWSRFETNMK